MSKFIQLQEEMYVTLLRYSNAIDRLYAIDDNFKKAIVDNFGTQHSALVIEAMQWMLAKTQAAQEQQKALEAKKTLDAAAKP